MQSKLVAISIFLVLYFVFYLSLSSIFTATSLPQFRQPKPILDQRLASPRIWIAMGLCISSNTDLFGKSKYPYAPVTPLAVLLWKYFLPEVSVLVRIVNEEKEISSVWLEYAQTLREAGAEVEWLQSDGMDCVLKSQLIRLVAYEMPFIQPDDVIVPADVNSFVMSSQVLKPIQAHPELKAWIFQYDSSAYVESGTGETFSLNFLAATASTWKAIMNYEPRSNLSQWLETKVNDFDLDKNFTWYYDQWISTLGLLKARICTVPGTSGLWRHPGLSFDPDFDDSNQCFHGHKGYSDCNQDIHIVYGGCKWWHFFPHQSFEEHVAKFHELTNNTFDLDLRSPFEDDD